jgi:hypothetical protein
MAETWYAMVVLEGSLVSLQISCQARHVEEARQILKAQYGIKSWLAGPNRQRFQS